jgi:hypothetical protein
VRVRTAAAPGVVTVTASSKSLGGRKLRVAVRARWPPRTLRRDLHATPHVACALTPRGMQVIGGGPSGACAAETLAKAGIETFLIERKMDNCKPCGGAIPLCMIDEFDLPMEIIDRKARAGLAARLRALCCATCSTANRQRSGCRAHSDSPVRFVCFCPVSFCR